VERDPIRQQVFLIQTSDVESLTTGVEYMLYSIYEPRSIIRRYFQTFSSCLLLRVYKRVGEGGRQIKNNFVPR
jgi:hypothetical protein